MKKIKKYRYIGRNGIITSTILIDGTNPILMYALEADKGKILYNGERYGYATTIFADELENWKEIPESEWTEKNNNN